MTAGRNRSFDKNEALHKAMTVFWKNGYTGTSLSELTYAMDINKPSLYSAFGNKEALFNQTIKLYLHEYGQEHASHLFIGNLTTYEKIKNYLTSIATMVSNENLPKGCYICLTTAELAGDCLPESASHVIETINQQTKLGLIEFFKNEIKAGNKLNTDDPITMANYILTLQFGLAIAGRNGSSLEELKKIVELSIVNLLGAPIDDA